ncbi:MAG: class I SAM-dependent methyltransferase [Desulfobacteria bacterium]
MTKEMRIEDVARMFGTTKEDLGEECVARLAGMDLRYRSIDGTERDELILRILKRIDEGGIPASGEERQPDWERGWGENLEEFVRSGYDVEALVPKYFRKNVPVRLDGEFVLPLDPDFVLKFTRAFRCWILGKYLGTAGTVYEFGCGPGTHLAWLAGRFPGRRLVGLDWASSSQSILGTMAEKLGWPVTGRRFDFFAPDRSLRLEANSAVFTFGALEQVGDRHAAFLEYLLEQPIAVCINVECLHELYDKTRLTDYLALKYHKRKNYLEGYLEQLRLLASEDRISIERVHHQKFGNAFDDPHSYVVWRPL